MGFTEEMNGLLDTEIAVIMNDGQAYRGHLKKFDKEIMVLEEVYETSNQEIDWVETKDAKTKATTIKGYVPWRRVTLPKLIVRTEMVLRIWPWGPRDLEALDRATMKKLAKKPKKAKSKK